MKIEGLWTPRVNTCDWPSELAADAIALWACGPAFLTAMQNALDNDNIQPYEISESHPPYELRLRMLLDLAENLEWGRYSSGLKAVLRRWQISDYAVRTNEYSAMADNSLAEECSSQIAKACHSWEIPRCTPELAQEIQLKIEAGQEPDSAVEFVLGAWTTNQSSQEYGHAWTSRMLGRLVELLNGDT